MQPLPIPPIGDVVLNPTLAKLRYRQHNTRVREVMYYISIFCATRHQAPVRFHISRCMIPCLLYDWLMKYCTNDIMQFSNLHIYIAGMLRLDFEIILWERKVNAQSSRNRTFLFTLRCQLKLPLLIIFMDKGTPTAQRRAQCSDLLEINR